MTTAGIVHRRGSKLISDDALAAEVLAARRLLVARDRAFVAALHHEIRAGTERLEAVLGERKPRIVPPAPVAPEWLNGLGGAKPNPSSPWRR